MTTNDVRFPTEPEPSDPQLVSALGSLSGRAPATLPGKVFAHWASAPSRLGEVFVAFTEAGVQFVRPARSVQGDVEQFAHAYRARFARPLQPAARVPAGVVPALRGRPARDLSLDLAGLSPFAQAVLAATGRIPAGQTRPYSWVAREAGSPRAVRAVGSVLARNPVPLLVPCHRVVRADGALGEYMFGAGPKDELLRGEDVNLDEVEALALRGVHYLASDTTGIVCFPTCRDARRITPAHRHGFRTLDQAVADGYRPCRTCRPAVELTG
jgi:O-6-methylguanine DNA methyltransferase